MPALKRFARPLDLGDSGVARSLVEAFRFKLHAACRVWKGHVMKSLKTPPTTVRSSTLFRHVFYAWGHMQA